MSFCLWIILHVLVSKFVPFLIKIDICTCIRLLNKIPDRKLDQIWMQQKCFNACGPRVSKSPCKSPWVRTSGSSTGSRPSWTSSCLGPMSCSSSGIFFPQTGWNLPAPLPFPPWQMSFWLLGPQRTPVQLMVSPWASVCLPAPPWPSLCPAPHQTLLRLPTPLRMSLCLPAPLRMRLCQGYAEIIAWRTCVRFWLLSTSI